MRLLTPPSSRQGASPATHDLALGLMLRTSRTSPLSRSDLVLWHMSGVRGSAQNSPPLKHERTCEAAHGLTANSSPWPRVAPDRASLPRFHNPSLRESTV